MSGRLPLALLLTLAALALPSAAQAATTTVLRGDGIGPLSLGMSQADALATGWLADEGTGCELGGPPLPVTYRLAGPQAPDGLRGSVEFTSGALTNVTVTRGARTAAGVTVRRTTLAGMVRIYRRHGRRVRSSFEEVFQGTFVTVLRGNRQVLGGFGKGLRVTTLAIPGIQVCE